MHLSTLDWVSFILYMVGIAAIGIYFSFRNNSTESYFLGNRSLSGWVVGLSMIGTSISSITFLAFPAAAFAGNWQPLGNNFALPLVAILAIVFFIPFFRRGNLVSAFEYLENRYGPLVRLYGAISFILLQLIRVGTILFLVSLLIHSFFPGSSMLLVIVVAGLFIGLYTAFGGIEAVIWTDVIQSVVLVIGGIACFVWIAWQLPGGTSQIVDIGVAQGNISLGDMGWKMSEDTFWVLFLLGIFNFLAEYSSNQNVVQRYAACKSTKDARIATIFCALGSVPIWVFFFFLGNCLFAYYYVSGDANVLKVGADSAVEYVMQKDKVFPYFLSSGHFPLVGVVIAGVLAAAMSSLDSSINAISAVSVVDILKRYLCKGRSDRFYLISAKAIAIVTTLLMITLAALVSSVDEQMYDNINNLWLILGSVFGGCLVGLFLAGFFTTRIHYRAALLAVVCAIVANIYLILNILGWLPEALALPLAKKWVAILVNVVFVIVALVASLLWKKGQDKDLTGLTVWT